jgi:hypothetical protein
MRYDMKYSDGQKIQVGDRVILGSGGDGVVVADIGAGIFSPTFAKKDWSYLEYGIIIEFSKLGVIHFAEVDIDLVFLSRAK